MANLFKKLTNMYSGCQGDEQVLSLVGKVTMLSLYNVRPDGKRFRLSLGGGKESRKKVLIWGMEPVFALNCSDFGKYLPTTKKLLRKVVICQLSDVRSRGK